MSTTARSCSNVERAPALPMHMCCSARRMLQSIHVDSTSRSVRGVGIHVLVEDGHRCCHRRRRSRLRRLPIPAIPRALVPSLALHAGSAPVPSPFLEGRGVDRLVKASHNSKGRVLTRCRLTAGRDKGSVSAVCLAYPEARRTRGWGSLRGAPRALRAAYARSRAMRRPHHAAPGLRRDPRCGLGRRGGSYACRRHGRCRSRRRRP